MKKYLVSIVILVLFCILSVSFESQYINPETVSNYSVFYQPFIILGPASLIVELTQITILLAVFTMYFMGEIRKDLYQSGMYSILRYGSKRKWLNKKLIKISIELLLLVAIYYIASVLVAYITFNQVLDVNYMILIMQTLIFYLVFFAIIQIQICFEMYYTITIANAVVLIGSFLMINFYVLINESSFQLLKYIFFVNNISIIRSGVMENHGVLVIIMLIALNIIIYIINQVLISVKDII